MWRTSAIAILMALVTAASSCGGGSDKLPSQTRQNSAPSISISPSTAVVGSPDLTLTITGSNFFGAPHNFSQAVWSSNGNDTLLVTTFVSSTQLTAVVPANLLISPVAAQVFVQTGDPMGDLPPRRTGSVSFSVTTVPAGTPMISSISPSNAPAGSSDITLTITGSNFTNQSFRNTSIAFWTTDPNNLHDHGTMLHTTFVSSSQLTAVIPAALLQNASSVQIVVMNGDVMGMSDGFFGYPKSNAVTFTVSP
jgi:hypothetical protein